eukprot:TRINITY_DN11521_c1_g2_i1.p2 TRINITY_DN11521_c1_g2~~TRINITY_DN11521_c1_g2_i1.p2  ORF type:complete len:363 (+),score=93.39 TRINITY_DN11521_c1_g2_i1:2198-3286(+)
MALSSRAAFNAALNMAGRAMRAFGRPAVLDSRDAQATTLGFAFAGATTLHGDYATLESTKPLELPDVPEPSMPASIDFLTQTQSSVPTKYLLSDLQWDALLQGPLMDSDEYAGMKSEIIATHTRLQALCDRGATMAAESCVDLFKRFNAWLGAHAVAVTLQASPQGREAIEATLSSSSKQLASLQQRATTIQALLQLGRVDDAVKQAKRAIRACERLGHLLRMTHVMLTKARREANDRLSTCFAVTSGVFIVAVGADYIGYLPSLSSVPTEAASLLRDLAISGTLLMLGATAANWLASTEAERLMQRMQEAQLARVATQNNFENRLDEVLDLQEGIDVHALQEALKEDAINAIDVSDVSDED